MKIIPVQQGTDAWLYARAGIVTASELDNIITPAWKPRDGQTPEGYLYRKLAEKCMGIPLQSGGSWAMEQGSILENEAVPWFQFEYEKQVQRIGFITTDDGRVGCSPDGLLDDDGGIELKCPQPDTHLKYLLNGGVPNQYLAQVHGSMFVTGRPYWIFMSYSRQFPPLVVRVARDEKIIAAIKLAVDGFLKSFDEKYARIKAIKDAENAIKQAAYEKANDRSK